MRRHGGGGGRMGKTSNSSSNSGGGASLSWPMVGLVILLTILTFIFGVLPEEQYYAIMDFIGLDKAEIIIVLISPLAPLLIFFMFRWPVIKEEKERQEKREEEERIQAEKDTAAAIEMEKWQRENAHKYKNQVGPYANLNSNNKNKKDDS